MTDFDGLRAALLRLEGRGYKAYKGIAGSYRGAELELFVDHVQGDPFGAPSRLRVRVDPGRGGFPRDLIATPGRRVAVADHLQRAFADALGRRSRRRGTGHSGELRCLRPGQEVLRRTGVVVTAEGGVEARFRAGLPAAGRRVLGREAAEMLVEDVPAAVAGALLHAACDPAELRRHVETVEDARAIRDQLEARGLAAFVADGATLPRRSGVDDRPLEAERAIPFRSAPELRVTLSAPNSGELTGLGVPRGVTLIVGGGFHGKSTLLRALERGVYDHVPGDGRERVVTLPDTVKVRAEDGRRIAGTDISAFIGDLPGGQDTRRFHTDNASGSTSQAAGIVEALEIGSRCLLLDEDTSATNFMIRDARMQALVPAEREPITPFIDRVRGLYEEHGVSTILVMGGSGDYFDVADTVIAMHDYQPAEMTAESRRIASEIPSRRGVTPRGGVTPRRRAPLPESIDPSRAGRPVKIRTRGEDRVQFGREEVDLSAVEQIVETAQVDAMAAALVWGRGEFIDGRADMKEALETLHRRVGEEGLETLAEREPHGEHSEFRMAELAAFLNRLRSLRVNSLP